MSYYDTDTRKVLSVLCHGACFFSATVISIGIPLAIFFGFAILGLVGLFSVIAPLIAIVSVLANPHEPYRYILIFKLF